LKFLDEYSRCVTACKLISRRYHIDDIEFFLNGYRPIERPSEIIAAFNKVGDLRGFKVVYMTKEENELFLQAFKQHLGVN
jgi:hypothetical protein